MIRGTRAYERHSSYTEFPDLEAAQGLRRIGAGPVIGDLWAGSVRSSSLSNAGLASSA